MSEREWALLVALSDIGDDLVLDSGAYIPAMAGGAASGAAMPSSEKPTSVLGGSAKARWGSGKRSVWFLPATVAACAALIATVGILVGVLGHSFGFFPYREPDTTDGVTDGAVEPATDTAKEDTETSGELPTGREPEESDGEEPETFGDTYTVQSNSYGLPFTVFYCSDAFDKGYYFENTNESPTYALGEAAYQRIKQTEKHLGVEILVSNAGGYSQYASTLLNGTLAKEPVCDMILTHGTYGITELMIGHYLLDLAELPSLSLDADYWDRAGMDALAVHGDRFLGVGDFLLHEDSFVVTFNKDIAADVGLDAHLYTLVQDGGWTLDKLAECAASFTSENGDGKRDENDGYGLACNVQTAMLPFVTASDVTMIDHWGDGRYLLDWEASETEKRLVALDEFLYELMGERYTYAYTSVTGDPPLTMKSGRVLLETASLKETIRRSGGEVSVGYLPYPLFDRDQEDYRTLYSGGYLAVPAEIDHADMVGDVVETLMYRSQDFQDAYADYLLGGQAEERHMDALMLDKIRASLVCDPMTYLRTTSIKMDRLVFAISHHISGMGEGMSNAISSNHKAAVNELEKLLDKLLRA